MAKVGRLAVAHGLALALSCGACGCGTKIAQTAYKPTPENGAPVCGLTLKERLTITVIDVEDDIRYKTAGYADFPLDERIAFSVQPNGASRVAWLDDRLTSVHVTPLNDDQMRRGADIVVPGYDLGGLVAHDDGFAILTRRDDPGEPIGDIPGGSVVAPAAFLVRVKEGHELFAAPLTGTLNITDDPDNERRDCSTYLDGRLAYNGSKYGSYFVVRGCKGDWADGHYGDKLVYADDLGRHVKGGWTWRCSHDLGLRLIPEADVFTSLCISDAYPQVGTNLVIAGQPSRLLAPEVAWLGYSGAQFGSIIKLTDNSYFASWLSRGVKDPYASPIQAGMESHDIGFTRLSESYVPLQRPAWLSRTADADEANLHLAPYGPDRVLVVWDSIDNPTCDGGLCLGKYGGTHFRLSDTEGNFLAPEEILPAPPNSADDIAVFPNGDLGWAFAAEDRSYSSTLVTVGGIPSVPPIRRISVARLAYCSN